MARPPSYHSTHRLARQWKRTTRRWARPYPSGSQSVVILALVSALIVAAHQFLGLRTSHLNLLRDYRPVSLFYSTNKYLSQSWKNNDRSVQGHGPDLPPPASDCLLSGGLSEGETRHIGAIETDSMTTAAPTACLAMIIKNEGPILPRLFDSVRGFVSEYCIVDTGSTDDTMDVVRSMDMPGLLVEEPFVDFATTRNFLLDTCRERMTCDYLVLLDADMVLKASPEWDWAKLEGKDVYDLTQVSSIEYQNPRIIKRTADKIKVVGATHEYYDVPSEYSQGLLPKRLVYIDDVGDGKAKGDKFERDERLLRRELEREPDNVRTVFYLANTLKDQGKYAEAIPYYERRVAMGGWFAEADYSVYMLSTCYLALGDLDNARKYAEEAAFKGAAQRAEPLYFLAFHLHQHGQYDLAWHYAGLASAIPKPHVSEALFIATDIYDYWVAYEQASLCRHVFAKEPQSCMDKMAHFLENSHAPDGLHQYIRANLEVMKQPLF